MIAEPVNGKQIGFIMKDKKKGISQFGNVKLQGDDWLSYAKYDKAVNEVCEYLRIRKHVDGVFVHMHHPFQYKSREFKRLLKLMIVCNAGNYFGVAFNRTGILGDTIFSDFWHEYKKHTYRWWLENKKPLRKLLKKYKQVYRRRGGMQEGGTNDDVYYRNRYKVENYAANEEFRRVYDDDEPMDKHGFMKDYIFRNHKKEYSRWFDWPKDSKRAARRLKRGTLESDNSKTWQSLRAFDALTHANNIMLNARFVLTCDVGRKPHEDKAEIFLMDTALNREHIFLHAYANELTDDSSVFNGYQKIMEVFNHYMHIDFKNETIQFPTFRDNPRGDRWTHEKVLDLSDGGFIANGWPFGDSIASELMAQEYVWTSKSVISVGGGCATKGAKILTQVMRFFEATYNQENKEDKDD